MRKGRNRGYTRSCAPHILSVTDRLDDQYQTFTPFSSKTYHIYTQYGKRPVRHGGPIKTSTQASRTGQVSTYSTNQFCSQNCQNICCKKYCQHARRKSLSETCLLTNAQARQLQRENSQASEHRENLDM